jgi:16S rRNA (uracil1498-N3)-methyltransferase
VTPARLLLNGRVARPGAPFVPDDDEVHRLWDVLRLRAGDEVLLVEPSGAAWRAVVAGGRTFSLDVVGPAGAGRDAGAGVRVVLIVALLKSDRTELAVQKAVEAGVSEVRVAVCARSVPRPGPAEAARREHRLRRVAAEAARQCGRPAAPEVSLHPTLADAIGGVGGNRFRMDETPGKPSLAERLATDPDTAAGVAVAVGPEGSFTDDEVAVMTAAGFAPAGLGPRVLRAETAAIAAVVVTQAVAGDMR